MTVPTADCVAVKNVYRVISGQSKRIQRADRCPVPISPKRTCRNRRTFLIEFVTDPPTGAYFCEEHWEAAKVSGDCP